MTGRPPRPPAPTTVAEYIAAAPPPGQAALVQVHRILKAAAPNAQEAIKWGTPFFIEPRFVIAFAAHKAHLSIAPGARAMAAFKDDMAPYRTTQGTLCLPYAAPLPEALIRRMAEFCVKEVAARADAGFWPEA